MNKLEKLVYLSSRHDDLNLIGDRHEIIESFPSTDDPILLRWYYRNLSTNSENSQWTLDETIISRATSSPAHIMLEAVIYDLDHYASSKWSRENLANILQSIDATSNQNKPSLSQLFSELNGELQNRLLEVIDMEQETCEELKIRLFKSN